LVFGLSFCITFWLGTSVTHTKHLKSLKKIDKGLSWLRISYGAGKEFERSIYSLF